METAEYCIRRPAAAIFGHDRATGVLILNHTLKNNCLYYERWIPSLGTLQQLGVFSIKTLSNFHY